MLILKSLSVRTAATFAIPLICARSRARAPVLRIKGLWAANIVFPPPEAAKEVEMSFAGTMVRSAPGAGGMTATATAAAAAEKDAVL